MDVGTYIRRVQSGFGDFNEIVITVEEIIDWLNEAQTYVFRETQCYRNLYPAAANTFPVRIPDMLLLDKAQYGTSNPVNLQFTSQEAIDDWTNSPIFGIPTHFYLDGDRVALWPTPKSTDTTGCNIRYIPAPQDVTVVTPLDTVLQAPRPYHDDLVIFSLAGAHEKNENYRATELKMQEFQANVAYRRYELQMGIDQVYTIRQDPTDFDEYIYQYE